MPYKVIQWATGGVGRAAVAAVLDHPELELVGCWVHSADKDGRDVGEIADRAPIGVRATTDVDALLAADADCIVYAPLIPDEALVVRMLRAGKNIVTPVGWVYPNPAKTTEIEAACAAGGVTLHGSGIHPGGITERFPLMISSLSSAITAVRAEEFSDLRTYDAPDVIRHVMGFGGTPEQALASPMAGLLSGGFRSSVRMVVDVMGIADAKIVTRQDIAVATAPIDSPIGPIVPGQVAARRFRWQALVDEHPVVTAAVNWLMGEENLDPAWTWGEAGPRFEIEISGEPDVLVTFSGLHPHAVAEDTGHKADNPSVVATANHCVNAIPAVCRAAPGIKTYLDLPLYAGRPAASYR